ncbi:PREDICTED: protein regulator of cytokinesis 1-like [Dinoponera quadriceps]|uniref:Protein regulator of cytokinesis 1-like n=1 Tax=Dinoponera quadriceps TaxID=609295 RepID=A0A6P3XUW7_DINQU|nr:PREDICTED: protein regulator of cytokinesis 1-like [Dinoponera quadriceps]XP_014482350.1 PREDICTED: protein regulator of cytokinesis 1-like [Dinoponera quadriceps]
MTDQLEWKPIVQKTIVELEQALDELQKIWEDIGCNKETRAMYYEQAHSHITDLLNDMVAESQTKKQLLVDSIESLLEQTTVLYAELHLDMVPNTYDQVPLSKVEQMLRADLKNLEHVKKERLLILKELLAKELDIATKLGAKGLSISENILPTEQELENFKLYLQKQENEKNRLENVFTDMRCSVVKMMNDLDKTPSSSFEHLIYNNPDDFVLNTTNMTKLRDFRDQLKVQLEETRCRVEKMKEDLMKLWKYLDEPETCHSFLEKYPGYCAATVNALNTEIKRCKEKKKENISKHVMDLRYQLINLWDLCKFCEAERNSFAAFHSSTFTEDLLILHEMEVEKLQKFYDDNQVIFDLLEQRENLLKKTKELIQRENNPDRFHNRGGQLLMEEKERKVIQKKLPKMEEELKQLMNEYEKKHNRIFTIYGISLENILAESWEDINHEKENIRKGRREAKDKSVKKSPLNSSKKTPGTSHLSIHKGPLGLLKRKLFSLSPNTSAKRRNKIVDKNKPSVAGSKIRRSGKLAKNNQKGLKNIPRRSRGSASANNSIMDTTYNQFQGHMTSREELHSSMIPEQMLKISSKINVKTPVRTPAKPLRKNLITVTTPTSNSARKSPHSPRTVNTPKLATALSNLPFIF